MNGVTKENARNVSTKQIAITPRIAEITCVEKHPEPVDYLGTIMRWETRLTGI